MAVAGSSQTGPIATESYLPAPKEIQRFLDAPRYLNATLGNQSPGNRFFLQSESAGMVKLADLGHPYHNLAGLMIDYQANRARTLRTSGAAALVIIDTTDWTRRRIEAPKGTKLSNATWSPDGTMIAYMVNGPTASTIHIADPMSGKTRQLAKAPILATMTRFAWSGDSKSIFCQILPTGRSAEPSRSPIAAQPRVHVTDPAKNKLRTFRTSSMLKSTEEQAMLTYYLTGQLAKFDAKTGKCDPIGKPAMIQAFDPAPRGDYVRVTTVLEPFSYVVQMGSFGRKEEVWDLTGKSLVELSSRQLSTGGADTPPRPDPRRNLSWRPDGNGFSYIQAAEAPRQGSTQEEDEQGLGGGGRRGAQTGDTTPRKDQVFQWVAPFGKDNAKPIYSGDNAIGSLQYSADCQTIYITETVSGTETLSAINLKSPSIKTKIYSYRPGGATESVDSPGSLVTTEGPLGQPVVAPVNGGVFLRGTQNPKDPAVEGPRPFLDRVELSSGEKKRLWQGPADAFEVIGGFLSDDGSRLIINRESATEIDQSYLYENGKLGVKLTENVDYTPDITAAQRMRIQVTRADGFKFWVKATMPKWWIRGMKLPAMFWFYPNELENQAAYDRAQRNYNKNLFPTLGNTNMSLLTRYGYAFIEPDCPIVGPTGRVNDYYINDLRNNLSATIDELERQGIIDRTKLALGGHSYGGFSTGNAMVHTPFFKAGIAGAGNYNRTLTPIAFQGETRMITEARSTYLDMSPILYAENLSGALLMYCGMDDQNVGTDPINSERMFNVLESIGKTASLYMYPYEDHGQVAKETIQDMWARWVPWLQKYVEGKN